MGGHRAHVYGRRDVHRPEGAFVGRQALNDQAQKLLDAILAGFVFEEDGPRYVGTDVAALAWRVGPPAHPVARGIDILTIRDGRVSVVRTLLAPGQGTVHGGGVPGG